MGQLDFNSRVVTYYRDGGNRQNMTWEFAKSLADEFILPIGGHELVIRWIMRHLEERSQLLHQLAVEYIRRSK